MFIENEDVGKELANRQAITALFRDKETESREDYADESKYNNKKGGYIGARTSIYVVFIIILLFLYFIYVYQENIYSVIYNGRNTLCTSIYPSICISKG